MNDSVRAVKVPLPHIALAVVAVGVGLGALSRLTGADEGPVPTPGRIVDEFGVQNERIGVSSRDQGATQLPIVEFALDTPKAKVRDIKAWIEGADGARLDLAEIPKDSPHMRGFGRLGYYQAVKSPRLIVQNAGQKVIDKTIPDLPRPMRAIPLVVPIASDLRLRPPSQDESKALGKAYPGESFYVLDSPGDRAWNLPTHILRSEWTAQASVGFRLPGHPEMRPAFGISDADARGLVELDIPQFFEEKLTREAILDIEIVDREGTPTIRVLKPMTVLFPDGASYEIRPSEKSASKGNGPDAQRSFGLSLRDVNGHPALISPPRKVFEIMPMPPVERKGSGHPNFDGRKDFNIELLSPTPASLGMRRLRVGVFEFAAKEETLPPLAYGRHRLRFRLTRSNVAVIDRRLFVPIEGK
ncbi:MAG: hypothetical protein ACO1SV_02165 [Fimbriimonas sp.]